MTHNKEPIFLTGSTEEIQAAIIKLRSEGYEGPIHVEGWHIRVGDFKSEPLEDWRQI